MRVTVLGAGAMGSAITTPLLGAGHEVHLWGTHLDDHLVDAVRAGRPHPRTGVIVPAEVTAYRHGELAEAMAGTELVVLAVASVGVEDITRLAAEHLGGVQAVLLTSKGFATAPDGRVELLPQAVLRVLADQGTPALPVVAVGGPCKANEVADARPTAAIFALAAADGDVTRWTALAATDRYRAAASTDRDGVELCAALKNVFAIALGTADGRGDAAQAEGAQPFHDLKSAMFAQTVAELRTTLTVAGADPWTAAGLAGAGDLEVTGLSGRNKLFGVRVGRGQPTREALAEMAAAEQTVEGAAALPLALTWVQQQDPALLDRLPLLRTLGRVLLDGAPVEELDQAALPTR